MSASHTPRSWHGLDELEAVADEMFRQQQRANERITAGDFDSLAQYEELLETVAGGWDDAELLDIHAEQLATEE